jgi:hypothetical protein
MNTIHTLSPLDVAVLKAAIDTPRLPDAGAPDWLAMGREYQMGDRTCLASPELVVFLMDQLEQAQFAYSVLKACYVAQGHLLAAANRTAARVEGQ